MDGSTFHMTYLTPLKFKVTGVLRLPNLTKSWHEINYEDNQGDCSNMTVIFLCSNHARIQI